MKKAAITMPYIFNKILLFFYTPILVSLKSRPSFLAKARYIIFILLCKSIKALILSNFSQKIY